MKAQGLLSERRSEQRFARSNRRRAADDDVDVAAHPLLAVKLPAWRSKLMLFFLFCAFVALALRAVILQGGVKTEFLQKQGDVRYARTLDVPATRGKIVDRNGVVLAASVPARAIWAIPDDADLKPQQLQQLAQLLQMPVADLKRRLSADDRSFVYVKRQVEPDVAQKIAALKLSGIHQTREFKRYYPEASTAAHVIGFTNVEDRGQEGVELSQQSTLAGRNGSRRVIKDRLGNIVEDDWLQAPVDGKELALSIDNRLQYIAFSAVKHAVDTHHAKAGAAVVLDVVTGELLALANYPSFDPNQPRTQWHADALRNRALTDTFEPGSTLKPFSVAAALEAGTTKPDLRIQTAPGWIKVADRVIRDAHPHGVLSVEQIVAKSSNVGTVKIAMELPAQTLWDKYTGVGFGQAPHVGFPGAVAGRLRPAKAWREVEQATISYGYGVSVSLMQLARAYTVFARDGDVVPVSLVRRDQPDKSTIGTPVLKPETARTMRRMLELAVSDEGTAPAARIAGYRVGGKTGTARKLVNGQYVNSYIASFAGFAPVSNPRLVIAVMIDEPGGGRYYGGDIAAPVFAQIASNSLRMLQVPPDAAPMHQDEKPLLVRATTVAAAASANVGAR